jgi:PAS domain S-box-containing protein
MHSECKGSAGFPLGPGRRPLFSAITPARLPGLNLLLAAAYALAALAGLQLAGVGREVSPIGPAAGLAYAALFVFGPALAPGVALGAWVAHLANGSSIGVALGFAAGSTLAPLAGALLSRRFVPRPRQLIATVRGVWTMTLAGAYGANLLSATAGVLTLLAAGQLAGSGATSAWIGWWLGDALGVMIVAPVLLAWSYREPFARGGKRALELLVAAACVVGLATLAFGDVAVGLPNHHLHLYLVIPFMIWLGLRYSPITVALVNLVLAAVVSRLVAVGLGTHLAAELGPRLEFLHGFLAITGFSALILAAAVSERQRAQQVLRESEARFKTLTALSSDWYWELDRDLRLRALAGRDTLVPAAVAAGQIGAVPWEMPFFERGATFLPQMRRLLEAHKPVEDLLVRTADGQGGWRYARLAGQPMTDESGTFLGYRGVGKDVTREVRAQEALRRSEARFRGLADLSSDWYWEQDERFRFTRLDGHGLEVSGLRAEDFLGKACWEIPLFEMDPAFWSRHRATLAAQRPFRDLVLRWRDRSGRLRHFRTSGEPVTDRLGAFIGYRGVGKDVTAEVEAQEAVMVSAQRLRTLIEATPDPVVMKDVDGRWVVANDAALRAAGLERIPWFGCTDEELMADARRRETGLLPWACGKPWGAEEAEVCRCEKQAVGEQGATSHFDVVCKALPHAPGKAAGRVVLCRDVTHLKEAEQVQRRQLEEIRRLNDELEFRVRARTAALEASNQELEAFSYSISHDLRAPLRALDGFSRLLEEDYEELLEEQGRDHLRRIRRASQRMGDLIDDLLKLSRISRSQVKRAAVDVSVRAAEILRELAEAEPERAIEWRVAPGLAAEADEGLVRAALENLLRNAWKFTRQTPDARIEVGRAQRKGSEVFYVEDNGVGFDMEHAARLFSPFQRLHRPEHFEGTGIGLAIVQRIVRLHGGDVWAESAPGRGARFYFSFG